MMRMLAAGLLALVPAAAWANCSTVELQICTHAPLSTGDVNEAVCGHVQCATADATFEFFRFADGATARIDYTGNTSGLMNAELPSSQAAGGKVRYEDLPVGVSTDADGYVSITNGDESVLWAKPCDDRCAGEDPALYE